MDSNEEYLEIPTGEQVDFEDTVDDNIDWTSYPDDFN